jgi:hypothetical protein
LKQTEQHELTILAVCFTGNKEAIFWKIWSTTRKSYVICAMLEEPKVRANPNSCIHNMHGGYAYQYG